MSRRASVRYYASRRAYFTHFEGKQIRLAEGPDDAANGPTYLKALTTFSQMMQITNADSADQANTVNLIVELYSQNLHRNGQLKTLKVMEDTCDSAVKCFGEKTMGELKPIHVTEWLAKMAKPRPHTHKSKINKEGEFKMSKVRMVKWGPGYQAIALRALITALNWAKGQGIISRHCLENAKAVKLRHKKRTRGKEAYIPPDTWKKLIGRVARTNERFGDLLQFLHDTGCRPAEAYHVEARYYHKADKCIIYPGQPAEDEFAWKNARRTNKDRVIFLSDELATMVERRILMFPEGPIFRTRTNVIWTNEAVSVNLRWYAQKLGIKPPPTAYGLRHSYATDWLLAGGSIKILADLIGTSVTMLERHYAHLMVDKERMRSIMLSVMKERNSGKELKAAVG